MRKNLCSFILCWATGVGCGSGYAQEPPKLPAAKLDYSKEAFIIEQDSTRVVFENDGTGTRQSTSRIRIQSDAGVQHWGILRFTYENSTQNVDIDYVRVRKPDNTVVSTSSDGVQDNPAEITREAPFYSDIREKQLAVKGLSVGDVLEIQSHWHTTKPLAPGQFWFAYSFSHGSVILQEQLEIRIPRDRPIKWKSSFLQPVIAVEGDRRVFTWTSSQLERKSSEQEKTQTKEEARQLVRGQVSPPDLLVSSFQSWEEVGRWYNGLQQERVKPTPEVRAKAAELTKNASDDAAKLRAIYGYVSTQFRYIGVDFGIGRYQPHAASEVLANQYGDCKDKHTLLASLLDAAGIKAYPALISSSHALEAEVPSPGQFDHVISAIPQGSVLTWLDTTPEVAPFGYLISRLRGKPALVVFEDKAPTLAAVPEDSPAKVLQTFVVKAKLNDTGTLEGRIERSIEGDDNEVLLRSAFRSVPLPNWKDLVQQISYSSGYAGEVSEVSAGTPEKTDKPFTIAYHYTRKDYPDWSGRRISPPLPPIAMPGSEDDDKTPPHSIWLGSPQEIDATSEVEIPKGYTAEIPRRLDLDLSFAEYHASSSFRDGVLTTERRLILKRRELGVGDYESYQKFRKRVTDDHEVYVPLYSGRRPPATQNSFQEDIWRLPGSSNHEAEEAFEDVRNAHDPTGAVSAIQHAVELDPKFTRAWLALGQMYDTLRQPDMALRSYRKAIEADPQQPVSYRILATTLMTAGKPEEAVSVWQELIKVAPESADGPSGLGSALVTLKRYREAASTLEMAVKMDPQKANSQGQLGSAYLLAGDEAKALTTFQLALNLDPSPARYNDVAYALADAGKQLPTALDYARKAVREEEEATQKIKLSELQTQDLQSMVGLAAFWDTLGWVQFRQGHFDEAAKYLDASWLLSQRVVVADHLGQVYEKQNKTAAAVKMYRLALAATPARLAQADSTKTIHARLEHLSHAKTGTRGWPYLDEGAALSQMRSSKVNRFAQGTSTAEIFLQLAWDSKTSEFKVEDWKFVSGSDKLKPSAQDLHAIHFNLSSPDGSPIRLARRGILGCYQYTGCSLVLFDPDLVRSVN